MPHSIYQNYRSLCTADNVDSRSAVQEIPRLLCNPKAYFRALINPLLRHIVSHTLKPDFSRSAKWALPFICTCAHKHCIKECCEAPEPTAGIRRDETRLLLQN